MNIRSVVAVLALTGCATTLDPNYALQMDAYRQTVQSQQNVAIAQARAEEARFNALALIADRSDAASKQMAILALALSRNGSVDTRAIPVQLPNIPENQEDRALKWAAIFAGPVIGIAQGYFGYKLGVAQSNNTSNSTIASYNTLGTIAAGGFASNSSIATSGFASNSSIATAGFGTLATTATRPNITVTNGVIGAGSYTGANSGANSGNSGRINSDDNNQRNCTATSGDSSTANPGTC